MSEHKFCGFGFGPIQSGLFVKEAYQSGNFSRIVVAEIDQALVEAVGANKGDYYVNVATSDGIETFKIKDVELFNPTVDADRKVLIDALAESTEIVTCLPSVDFYDTGGAGSVASLIANGLKNSKVEATIIYTAENNNHAAEILEAAVGKKVGSLENRAQFLDTVIAKMSRVVIGREEIAELALEPIAPGIDRAFLVEEFNRILVSKTQLGDFEPGIEVFIEKENLLSFEVAKLYGHNAIHALLAYLGAVKGYTKMTEVKNDESVMEIARRAFLDECCAALIKKYGRMGDELFTEAGYRDYAEELLERITNPYLGDTVARAGRDVVRKLGPDDRIFGTMQLAIEYGIEPVNMALGAMAAIVVLLSEAEKNGVPDKLRFEDWRRLDNMQIEKIINWIWGRKKGKYGKQLIGCVQEARERLVKFVGE